jgi:putative ABC transport system permease protein
MNIMLVAVAERTREIGIRKSLGARRRDILRQFMVESATLATIGAMLGVALGIGFAKGLAAVSPLPAAIELWSIFLGVGVGAGVGMIAGIYPASRASMLDPIAAMRQET